MKQDSKQRLIEVMQRLDKTFKPKLNEGETPITDPTKEEMVNFLTQKFQGLIDPAEVDANNFDIESAIYWFANDYHGGQNSNLYSVLSTSEFRPGPMHKSIEDEESETATMMYQELVNQYGGGMSENIHNTPMMGGILNSRGTAGYDPDATNKNQKTGKDFYDPQQRADSLKRLRGLEENKNIFKGKYGYLTIDEPIIPDAIQVISQNPNAIKFTDKQSYDEFANQQRYFSASHSHAFYSPEEMEEWRKSGNRYKDPDSEQSDILFNTGHEPVQVWDNKNQIGYVVPSERNKEGVQEGDAFNDAGEPMMSHSQYRDYSEPAEPDYDQDRDVPQYNKGMGKFTDIDWKVVYETILQNSQNPDSPDNATVNDFTDYDGMLSPEELNALKWGNVGVWFDNAGDYPMFDVADGDPFPTYEEFYAKAKDVFEHPEKIQTSGGNNDSEAPYMRGYEPMSENITKKRLFEMMHKINPDSKRKIL